MNPVPPTTARLRVMREGRAIVREWQVPKPVVLVDTRERTPLPLFKQHPNWIGGVRPATLKTGDYSVEGMENLLALERKTLPDAVQAKVKALTAKTTLNGQPLPQHMDATKPSVEPNH